jgi:hypothetical protein
VGFVATEEEDYRRTVDRIQRLDDNEIGRDAASIDRSLLVFESSGAYEVTPPTRAFSSEDAFRDLVGKVFGSRAELVFYFPEAEEHRRTMEKVAAILPEFGISR